MRLVDNEACKHYDASNRKRILLFSIIVVGGIDQVARAGYSFVRDCVRRSDNRLNSDIVRRIPFFI